MAKKIIILLIIILFTLSPLGISANTIDLQIQILQLQIKVLQLQVQRLLILLEQAFATQGQVFVQEIQDIQALEIDEPIIEPTPEIIPELSFIEAPQKTTSYLRSDGKWIYQIACLDGFPKCFSSNYPEGIGIGTWQTEIGIRTEITTDFGTGDYSCICKQGNIISSSTDFTLKEPYPPYYFQKWGGSISDNQIPIAP